MIAGARNAGLDPDDRANWRCLYGSCSPAESQKAVTLDFHRAQALLLFQKCGTQWMRSDFDGSRQGLPVERVREKAQIHGIDLDAFTLECIEVAEAVILEDDALAREASK
jgi:hypothetical protein